MTAIDQARIRLGQCFPERASGGCDSIRHFPLGFTYSSSVALDSGDSNPFVGAVPGHLLTDMADFDIASPNATLIDAAFNVPELLTDARGNCRNDGANDIGAFDFGSVACSFGAVVPPAMMGSGVGGGGFSQ